MFSKRAVKNFTVKFTADTWACPLTKCDRHTQIYTRGCKFKNQAEIQGAKKTHCKTLEEIIIIIIGIQPLGRSGQRPELSQVTGMALVRCILGKFLGVVCHCLIHKSKGKGHPATARGSG